MLVWENDVRISPNYSSFWSTSLMFFFFFSFVVRYLPYILYRILSLSLFERIEYHIDILYIGEKYKLIKLWATKLCYQFRLLSKGIVILISLILLSFFSFFFFCIHPVRYFYVKPGCIRWFSIRFYFSLFISVWNIGILFERLKEKV